jgi:paraquat-inducible protein B
VSRRANPTLIGGFVLGGALLAVIAVVVFGSGQLFRDTATFISFFDGSVSGLGVGSPVRFRGIDVGSVRDVLLDLPGVGREERDLRIAVVYDLDRQSLESRGAMARLSNPFDIDTLLALGIRAELATESLVTGRKYIALDLDPDRPVASEPVAGAPFPEIPTVTTGLERIEEEVYELIAQLGAVRLDTLVTVATEAFGQMGQLASSPELTAAIQGLPGTIGRFDAAIGDLQALMVRVDSSLVPLGPEVTRTAEQATRTLQRLDSTLADVGVVLEDAGGVFEPESPLFIRFERAMTDLGDASRALRDLADYLERNPSALIRGRPGGGE